MYPDLFKGLRIMELDHHLKLNDNASLTVHPPRKISTGLHEKLKKELKILEKAGE